MQKKFFFLPLLAALVMAGCSKEDSEGIGGGNSDTHYLAVNISSTPSLGSRADGQYDTGSNGAYEDGTKEENKVNTLRFYFFSSGGAAVNVKANSTVNYLDITTDTLQMNTPDHNQTVSEKLKAVLIIDTKAGDRLPALIATVINPPTTWKKAMNLTEFRAYQADLTAGDNGFIMSDAVYVSDQKKIESITAINPAQYHNTRDEAIADPLQIYVERAVAKVRVSLSANLQPASKGVADIDKATSGNENLSVTTADGKTHNLIKLKYLDGKDEKDLKIGEGEAAKQVYVELNGWNVTARRPEAYLIKHLQDAWKTSDIEGIGSSWNLYQLHRCFWADYCNGAGNNYFNFDDSHAQTFESNNNYTYCNENAERETGTLATKVIIPAVLCDETAAPLKLCEFVGVRYIDNDNLNQSKMNVLNAMKIGQKEFWTLTDDGKSYREMDERDIEFTTNYQTVDASKTNRYYAEPKLTDAAKAQTWLKSNPVSKDENSGTNWTEAAISEILENIHINIWKDGKTYYYFDIRHLGTDNMKPSYYGVVRNHIYDITVNNIYGLGTPVFNPEQVIIPEPVNPDEVYIAAQINILSWRLVSTPVTIDTGK